MADFVKVAAVDQIPANTGFVVAVNGEEVALFKVGNSVYAIENECPHREGPLGEGDLDGEIVTCPFHMWEVNVRTGEVVYNPGICAKTYACKVEGGDVFVEAKDEG